MIAGHPYDNGVFAHAPSDVRYHIGGKYAFFSGCVGLDDGNVADAGGSATCGDGVDFKVIVDGEEKFKHHASGGEAAKCFRMSVKGANKLQLVADHRTDKNCDESAWVNTKLYEDPIIDCMQLGDLTPSFKSVGYVGYFINKNWYDQGFMINSVRYDQGVFAHAHSKLVYPLHGKYHTFHGCAGVDDGNDGSTCGEGAHFEVRSDGLKRWERQITQGESAQCFSMSVADAFALELRTSKGSTNNACDRTEWVNADLCITTGSKTKVDCVVEDWTDSSWSTCSKKCNTGYMSRSRKITTHPESRTT
jgi:alpha-galactosidase